MAKGQVSMEILVLVGLMLMLLLPLLIYSYGRANVVREDLGVQKAEFAVQRLASLADSVGYIGGNASIIEEIEVPPQARSLKAVNGDIVMELYSNGRWVQIAKSSAFTLHESPASGLGKITSGGTYFIEVRADSDVSSGSQSVTLSLK